jgi:hypothetical protein
MSDALQAAAEKLRALGVELPDPCTAADLAAALGQVTATIRAAKKLVPDTPPVRFETRERKDGTSEVVLVVRRGGKGQPLAVTAHAAELLRQMPEVLARFAETGEIQELPEVVEPSADDDEPAEA